MTMRYGEHVVARFQSIGNGVRERMVAVLEKFSYDLEQHIQVNKLSGQVLNRRSGQLSRSINHRVVSSANSVSGVVGANMDQAKYAAAHEYGFRGTVMVPAHQRMQTMAFGRAISPRMVTVRAHPMRMNLPERSFLRSGLSDKAPEGVAAIRAALLDLLKESAE